MLDKERLQSSGVLQTQMTVLLLTLHQTCHLSAASSRKKAWKPILADNKRSSASETEC